MNTAQHLEETLQRDIDLLKGKLTEMAARSIGALKGSLQALRNCNRRQAYLVILRDQYIDEMETELDRLCLEFLVRQQPVGIHLRFAYTVIQANKAIERIGDYAESIATQVLALSSSEIEPPLSRVEELGRLALKMVVDSVQALVEQDGALALKTIELEPQTNALRNSINSELLELSKSGRLTPAALGPLNTVVRRLERSADQAKNICEEVLYLCTGEFIKHKHPDGIRILFVDRGNSCLSQMAEAIGKSMGLSGFSFSSAGVQPQPIDTATVDFLAQNGLDASQQKSKALEDVPQWSRSNVLIALASDVREALTPRSTKTVVLTWSVADPLSTSEARIRQQAFTSAFEFLTSNIRELTDAIIDNHTKETNTQLS